MGRKKEKRELELLADAAYTIQLLLVSPDKEKHRHFSVQVLEDIQQFIDGAGHWLDRDEKGDYL